MNNLLEKNIFYQKSKDKSNPDVLIKKSTIEKNRTEAVFKKSDLVYNSITNTVPENIRSPKDLELKRDLPLSNFEELMQQKIKERNEENNINKNIKQKVIVNDDLTIQNNQIYSELKNDQLEFSKIQNDKIKNNKDRYDDIIINLKNLGIINN